MTKDAANMIIPANPSPLPELLIFDVSPRLRALFEKIRPIIEPGRPKSEK